MNIRFDLFFLSSELCGACCKFHFLRFHSPQPPPPPRFHFQLFFSFLFSRFQYPIPTFSKVFDELRNYSCWISEEQQFFFFKIFYLRVFSLISSLFFSSFQIVVLFVVRQKSQFSRACLLSYFCWNFQIVFCKVFPPLIFSFHSRVFLCRLLTVFLCVEKNDEAMFSCCANCHVISIYPLKRKDFVFYSNRWNAGNLLSIRACALLHVRMCIVSIACTECIVVWLQ